MKLKEVPKKIWVLLIAGLLIRLLLAASTFHPDIRAFNLGGQLIAQGNLLNLYDFLSSCSQDNPLVKIFGSDLFIYPPLVYLFHAVFNFIFSFIFGQAVVNGMLIENTSFLGNPLFNLHLLLLKLPYLIFDGLGAFVIYKLFDTPREKILALALWLFNPVNLYATYMMGQFDLIPMFFTVLSLFFVKRNQLVYAALSLGLGAAFKVYPLLLILPLILLEKNWSKRIELGLISVLPYLITVAPFIASPGFRNSALLAGLTQKSFYAQIPISGGESLILYPLFLGFVYLMLLYTKNLKELLWEKFFVILLIFFIFTHYHPQWFLWITPFLIIDLVKNKFRFLLVTVILLVSFISSLFFFDASLTINMFAPLVPSLHSSRSVWHVLNLQIDINYVRSVLQSVFATAAVFYIFIYFPKLKNLDD